MKKAFLFYMIVICSVSMSLQAQQDMAAIRAAAETASRGVGNRRAHPDSLDWKKGGDVSLSFSWVDFSNWAAGGENSVSLSAASNLYANYKKDKMIWENYAFLAYGTIKTSDRPNFVKNSDQINIGSRVGYQMSNNWYYTAAMLGKTQFAPGFFKDTIKISDFLAPAYLFLSLGLDYKPSDRFGISFAPAMGKATFVRSSQERILVSAGIPQERIDEGKKSRYEFGGGLVLNMSGNYFENKVSYSSRLELFTNYFDKPQNVDIVWDFQLRIALTRYISAGLRLNMIYFDNQKTLKPVKQEDGTEKMEPIGGAQLQVKRFFEIGLFYGF